MNPENIVALVIGILIIPVVLGLGKGLLWYVIIEEAQVRVYTLFGKVIGIADNPGLYFPTKLFGAKALLIPFFGKSYRVSTALRQNYFRNQMVNSEEGTPMGVGIWYEMKVNDAVSYLFKNANPDASLEANVASSTISTLSNLEMEAMLENRHELSRTVRQAVSPLSEIWGYQLGSVYIRKVSFTDTMMVKNITEKVVKRLIQVTSAMKQDGENRVGLIKSQTAKKVSQTMAEATSARPKIVGNALNAIARTDPEILESVLTILETEKLLNNGSEVELIPANTKIILNHPAAS
ncbi:MAG: SPFH/Band 7/PHB domain protein [Planctomycetes bacterium]|nr:SPFH/Band 7/PHB domain protein [Planctomycetota bacterium]